MSVGKSMEMQRLLKVGWIDSLRIKTFVALISPLGSKGLGRYLGWNLIYRGLVRYLLPQGISTVEYDGFTLDIYRRGYPGMLVGGATKYLPIETRMFKSMIKPGMTILNLGANVGYYTLVSAKLVGPTGRVFAFEPFPEAFNLLERNIDRNGFSNVTLVNKAVSDSIGIVKLYLRDSNPLANSLGEGRTDSGSIEVPTTTLDILFGGTKVDVIRMNIEGSEPLALKGMEELLRHNPNLKMLVEFDPTALEGLGYSPKEYIDSLLKYFNLQVVQFRSDTIVPYETMEQLSESLSYRYGTTHLVCTRRSV